MLLILVGKIAGHKTAICPMTIQTHRNKQPQLVIYVTSIKRNICG